MKTGWGKGKNQIEPFTQSEWKNSYIKKNFGGTYAEYLHSHHREFVKKQIRKPTQRKQGYDTYNLIGNYTGYKLKVPKLF